MIKLLSPTQLAYIAGFLDGDGSIYVRAKPNPTYRYGFQIAPYIVFFQSSKSKKDFAKITKLIGVGYTRERKDGILEYTINRIEYSKEFLEAIYPFVILKRKQTALMLRIIAQKNLVKKESDFKFLLELVDSYRELNYSKRRIHRTLTP